MSYHERDLHLPYAPVQNTKQTYGWIISSGCTKTHLEVPLIALERGQDDQVSVAAGLVEHGGSVQVVPGLVRRLVDEVVRTHARLSLADAQDVHILQGSAMHRSSWVKEVTVGIY